MIPKTLLRPDGVTVAGGQFGVPRYGTDANGNPVYRHDHYGEDFSKWGEVPVRACEDGTVVYVDNNPAGGDGYGIHCIIKHIAPGETYATIYCHLRNCVLTTGQSVKRGAFIGLQGSTGFVDGQHLHLELVQDWTPLYGDYGGGTPGDRGNRLDPSLYFGEKPQEADLSPQQQEIQARLAVLATIITDAATAQGANKEPKLNALQKEVVKQIVADW